MEARTAYTTSGTRSQHISENESRHRLGTTFYFVESFAEPGGKGAFEMRHSFLLATSFCCAHCRIFARKFLVDLHTVCASPKKLARP